MKSSLKVIWEGAAPSAPWRLGKNMPPPGRARLRPRRDARGNACHRLVGRCSVRAVVLGEKHATAREGAAPSAPWRLGKNMPPPGRARLRPRRDASWEGVGGPSVCSAKVPVERCVGGHGSARTVVPRKRAAVMSERTRRQTPHKRTASFLYSITSKVIEIYKKSCVGYGNAFLAARGITLTRVVGWGMAIPIIIRARRPSMAVSSIAKVKER